MQEYILLGHVWLLSRHTGTNGKQLVPGQGALSMQPGLLHPENQQLPTARLFINHALWSYHASLAHGSTSHSVRDVELEEKDTEGGEKDKCHDLTDRAGVWLTLLLTQKYQFCH